MTGFLTMEILMQMGGVSLKPKVFFNSSQQMTIKAEVCKFPFFGLTRMNLFWTVWWTTEDWRKRLKKICNLPTFHVAWNLYDCFSSVEHRRKYFEDCRNITLFHIL